MGWDLERLREEEGSGDSGNGQGYLSHSRLLPLLIEEEVHLTSTGQSKMELFRRRNSEQRTVVSGGVQSQNQKMAIFVTTDIPSTKM